MDQVWIGYEDLAYTEASLTREVGAEVVRDNSGFPLLLGVNRVYATPLVLKTLREATFRVAFAGRLEVRSECPVRHRTIWVEGDEKRLHLTDITISLALQV